MLEIQHDKVMLEDKVLQFNKIIIEAAEYDGKVVVVFETDEDDGYDNIFCYTIDSKLLWRIKQTPVDIGGTARCQYVGVDVTNGKCRAIDYYGRRFLVDMENGQILSKDIVR